MKRLFFIFIIGIFVFISANDTPVLSNIKPIKTTKNDSISKAVTQKNQVNVTKKIKEIKSNLPKIPKEWGHLIHGEFLMDTAYLALYFEDNEGNVRVAIYSLGKKVKLYKLMVFPRENK